MRLRYIKHFVPVFVYDHQLRIRFETPYRVYTDGLGFFQEHVARSKYELSLDMRSFHIKRAYKRTSIIPNLERRYFAGTKRYLSYILNPSLFYRYARSTRLNYFGVAHE